MKTDLEYLLEASFKLPSYEIQEMIKNAIKMKQIDQDELDEQEALLRIKETKN